ncbi:hypothetical protein [Pseudotamlana carrageenivorans]|uniref:Uncharacterized protein n=1 Tax=Pseudotamlana carrageenivorans TaxID=2069432 RepID=A0A2I7SHT9_9FLAO|nr:hypothetical protein [Tamlana carrageenivorans]AUS05475.1 hypothetical protein C1A40_08340 [Tamlana carrageenivorans]
MKKLKYIIGLLACVIMFVACDEESNFKDFDAEKTPVFSLTEISNNGPFKINIYQDKPLIIEYITPVNASNFVTKNYSDSSNDTTFEITVTKIVELLDEDGEYIGEEEITYLVNADKTTGQGTLTENGTTVYDVMVTDTEVYN